MPFKSASLRVFKLKADLRFVGEVQLAVAGTWEDALFAGFTLVAAVWSESDHSGVVLLLTRPQPPSPWRLPLAAHRQFFDGTRS